MDKDLIPFEDNVLQEQQLSAICMGDGILQVELENFIQEVLDRSDHPHCMKQECMKEEVLQVFEVPELEHLSHNSDIWKTKLFKEYTREKGIEINLGQERRTKKSMERRQISII